MLTRCKRGMYIVTSKKYMERDGKESLVAKLANAYGEESWVGIQDVEELEF
jgi:hypothetical protein